MRGSSPPSSSSNSIALGLDFQTSLNQSMTSSTSVRRAGSAGKIGFCG